MVVAAVAVAALRRLANARKEAEWGETKTALSRRGRAFYRLAPLNTISL
jgi:hypothetical protein